MVAGDTKRIIVIKNISSNLIEEAILILRNGSDASHDGRTRDSQNKQDHRKEFILKEAEYIINQYIKENGLEKKKDKRCFLQDKFIHIKLAVNTVINALLASAIVFLLLVITKLF